MAECKDCGKGPLGKRNKSGYCYNCRNKHIPRCDKCGVIVGSTTHVCKSVDLQEDRRCCVCAKPLKYTGWERWSTQCRSCSGKRWAQWEKDERTRLRNEFGGKCKKCGYSGCSACLHFHHTDASEKYEWNFKGHGGADVREIKAHPERFELLCVRCHIELHFPDGPDAEDDK